MVMPLSLIHIYETKIDEALAAVGTIVKKALGE